MKTIFFLLFILILNNVFAENTCPLQNELIITPFTYTINDQVTLNDLEKKHADKSNNIIYRKKGDPLGEVVTEQTVSLKVIRDTNNCISFKVTAGFKPATILIANELKSNSCVYNTVLEHEMKHVKIYKEFNDLLYEKIKLRIDNLNVVVQNMTMDKAGNLALDEAYIEADKINELQQKVDSFEEYQANNFACHGQFKRTIGN